jgi:hypothetical protein
MVMAEGLGIGDFGLMFDRVLLAYFPLQIEQLQIANCKLNNQDFFCDLQFYFVHHTTE